MNIKSQKAKELIEYGKFSYDEIEAYVLPESYVETIIVQAEQDAENRAIEAYCKSECNGDCYCPKREKCYILKMFVDNLNNGGQSDE